MTDYPAAERHADGLNSTSYPGRYGPAGTV